MKTIKNFTYNMSYQILILIAPLITVPYISRVLGPTGVGINTFTNSIIQYFVLFGTIGIGLYGNREIAYVQDDKEARSRVFWEIEILKMITVGIALFAFIIFMMFYHRFQNYLIYQSLLLFAAAVDISWLYMGLEDFKKTVLRNTLVRIVSIILIFAFVKDRNDTGIYILILSGSQLIGNLTLWPYIKKDIGWPGLKNINIKMHLRPSLQMFIPQIAIQIYWVLNRTMLGQIVSVQSAGMFQYADQFVKMALAIATATGPVLLPRVSNAFANKDNDKVKRYLKDGFDFVSALSIPMVFGIIAIATPFASWFMGKQFYEVGPLMAIESPIIVFIAWSGVIGQQFLIPVNRIKEYTTSVLVGVTVNIILNFALIYPFGAIGAMIATVCSELSVTVYQLFKIRNYINVKQMILSCWKYLLSSVIMYYVVCTLMKFTPDSIIFLILSIIVGVIVYSILVVILKTRVYVITKDLILSRLKK